MKVRINKSKYEALKAEKDYLNRILQMHKHMKGTPNHTAVSFRHKRVTQEMRQLFKTGVRHD